MKKLKRWFSLFVLSLSSIFNKVQGKQGTESRQAGEQITEQDEWSRLLNDMQSPDAETREAAQKVWLDKRQRDTAFFDGFNVKSTKKKSERGLPMHTRVGWSNDALYDEHYRNDRDSDYTQQRQGSDHWEDPKDHYEGTEFRNIDHKYKERSADELDAEFYGTNPRNISKEELEQSVAAVRRQSKPNDGER